MAVHTVSSSSVATRPERHALRHIAERLVIAPATAKTHVGRVLSKLGLRDRVKAVVLSYKTRLAGEREA